MLNIGMIVDNRYRIIRQIGRGGTSCVYLAENIRIHNYWAIKEVYKSGFTGTGVTSSALIAESSILTKLRHPGLPAIIDIITTPKSYLIVMEYIEGVSLKDYLLKNKVCSQDDVVKWGIQLCDVLNYLHSQPIPIIYRDMKPANIMLRPNGDVVLIDFGMARKFNPSSVHDTTNLGTHGYAAPEQYSNDTQTDSRTDIYSLGMTLHHLVTGKDPCIPPFGVSPIRTINPSLSIQLEQIINICTRYDISQRYQNVSTLKNDLENINNTPKVPVFPNGEPKPKNKTGIIIAVAVCIFLVLISGAIAGVVGVYGKIIDGVMDYVSDDTYRESEYYVEINAADTRQVYVFVPEKSGYYNIYSVSEDGRPVVWVWDDYETLQGEDNTYGENEDVSLTCWLDAGETYHIETTLYDLDDSYPAVGAYWLYVNNQD